MLTRVKINQSIKTNLPTPELTIFLRYLGEVIWRILFIPIHYLLLPFQIILAAMHKDHLVSRMWFKTQSGHSCEGDIRKSGNSEVDENFIKTNYFSFRKHLHPWKPLWFQTQFLKTCVQFDTIQDQIEKKKILDSVYSSFFIHHSTQDLPWPPARRLREAMKKRT